MIDGVTNTEGIASLERLVQFAGQRHRLIVNNIANFDTPGFQPKDADPKDFQRLLGEAIDARCPLACGHERVPTPETRLAYAYLRRSAPFASLRRTGPAGSGPFQGSRRVLGRKPKRK